MIVQEILEENPDLIKTYSDAGKYIVNVDTGEKWSEAIDPVSMGRTYTESDIDIEDEEEEPEAVPVPIEELG